MRLARLRSPAALPLSFAPSVSWSESTLRGELWVELPPREHDQGRNFIPGCGYFRCQKLQWTGIVCRDKIVVGRRGVLGTPTSGWLGEAGG